MGIIRNLIPWTFVYCYLGIVLAEPCYNYSNGEGANLMNTNNKEFQIDVINEEQQTFVSAFYSPVVTGVSFCHKIDLVR